MVATVSAGTAAEYYIDKSNYYAGGPEPAGRWIVTSLVGVESGAIVEKEQFERLHAGLDTNGQFLLANKGGKRDRVGGYDCTFSAPKSCSILWMLADDDLRKAIEGAQAGAVDAAIQTLERNAAFCRYGKNGLHREKTRITVAAFQHGEARPSLHSDGQLFSECALHTHAIIVNIGPKKQHLTKFFEGGGEGEIGFGALDGKAIFAWKMALGAVYHAEFAKRLQDLGFAITEIGKNGIFEIEGIDAGLRAYFSTRRREIEDELAAAGASSASAPALAAAITRATRKPKQENAKIDRFAFWQDRACDLGFERQDVLAACVKAGQKQSALQLSDERERLISERLAQIPDILTEHDSTFERRHLHAAIAASFVGTGEGAVRVEAEIDKFVASRRVVALDRDVFGHEIFTTPEMLRIELEIGEIAGRLAERPFVPLNARRVGATISKSELNPEQTQAVYAATCSSPFTIIEGAPGSGKTTTLGAITQSFQEAGYRVVGTSTAWRVANMLRDDLQIESRATDSWLVTHENGGRFLDEKTVLIVDEAGLLSSRQMHALLSAVEAAGRNGVPAPRVVFVGDRDQLQSVGAGSGLGLVANVLPVQKVEQIVRQREVWAREAILAFGKGAADDGLKMFAEHGLLHEAQGAKANVAALVDAWEAATVKSPTQRTLLIAKTNVQVRAIAAEVRHRLRDQGVIQGPEVRLAAVTPSGHDVTLSLAQGDRLRFLTRAQVGGFEAINGTEAKIEAIHHTEDNRLELTIRTDQGRFRFFPADITDGKGRAKITHAYATTIHGAQGLTTDNALVWLSAEMDRHDVYVSSSRARHETQFFLDRKALNVRLAADLPLNERAKAPEPDEDDRRKFLARQLARSGVKQTSLDVLMAAHERAEERLRLQATPASEEENGIKKSVHASREMSVG